MGKRRHQRFVTSFDVFNAGTGQKLGVTHDLSTGGFRLLTAIHLEERTKLLLVADPHGEPATLLSRVAWRAGQGLGLAFVDLGTLEHDWLRRVLDARVLAGAPLVERRQRARVDLHEPISWSRAATSGVLANLSLGGALVETESTPAVGAVLDLDLAAFAKTRRKSSPPLHCRALVRHSHAGACGVAFVEPSAAVSTRIEELLLAVLYS